MAFREYKIGARLFGVALGGSMLITLYFPTVDMTSVAATEIGLRKGLAFGRVSGFSYQDPFLQGKNMPKTVMLKKDPGTGAPISSTRDDRQPARPRSAPGHRSHRPGRPQPLQLLLMIPCFSECSWLVIILSDFGNVEAKVSFLLKSSWIVV